MRFDDIELGFSIISDEETMNDFIKFPNKDNIDIIVISGNILLWPDIDNLDFSECSKLIEIIINNKSILHGPNVRITFSGTSTGTNSTIDINDLLNGKNINVSFSPNAGPLTIDRSSLGLPNITIKFYGCPTNKDY